MQTPSVNAFVAHGGLLPSRPCSPATSARQRVLPRAQAVPPRRPNPPPPRPSEPTPPPRRTPPPADVGPQLVAPRDPTPLRSESEVRRNRPAKRVPRRRRRGGATDEPAIEWDKAESVPLVGGGDGDGWVDLRGNARREQRKADDAARLERRRERMDEKVIEKLKQEIVQPYNQNWIGIVVIVIAVLAVAFKFSGGFETIPIIPVPDL